MLRGTPLNFLDAQQALGFLLPQFYTLEQTVYKKKYPSFDYAEFIPVETSGNPWSRGVMFRSSDFAGKAEWLAGKGFDMPYADVQRDQFLKAFELGGIGYERNTEEMEVAAMEGRDLGSEKADAARRIAEATLFQIAMNGRLPGAAASEKNWTGFINDANVPQAQVANDGTGPSRLWSAKTPDLILRDINAALTGITSATIETEMADTLLLPWARWDYIATTPRSSTSDTTILQYLQKNNAYTARTGRPLMVKALRVLDTAGTGGSTRMIAYRRDPEVVKMHLPMPHRFLPPFQKGSMTWEIAGIFRTGGVEIRLPKAVNYLDSF
jgi:hypothetical protein